MLTLQFGTSKVHALAFSPDSSRLAVAAGRKLAVVDWRAPGEPVWREPPHGANGYARMLTFDPDGVGIVASYNRWGVYHFGPTISEFRPRTTFDLLGITWSPILPAVVVHSGDPRQVIQLVTDGTYPTRSMLLLLPYAPGPAAAYLSKGVTKSPLRGLDYRPLTAWTDRHGRLVIWSQRLLRWYPWPPHGSEAEGHQFRPAPEVSGRVMRPQKLKVLAECPLPLADAVAPLPDGDTFLVALKGVMSRWHAPTGTELARWRWPKMQALRSLAVSPDGTVAAVGGNGGRVIVWDLDV